SVTTFSRMRIDRLEAIVTWPSRWGPQYGDFGHLLAARWGRGGRPGTFSPPGGEPIRMEPRMYTDERGSERPGGRPRAAGTPPSSSVSIRVHAWFRSSRCEAGDCRASVRRSRGRAVGQREVSSPTRRRAAAPRRPEEEILFDPVACLHGTDGLGPGLPPR